MSGVRLLGRLDPNFGWAAGVLRLSEACDGAPPPDLRGAYTCVTSEGPRPCIARDPLGLNKLFWAPDGSGLVLSARPWRLVDAGLAFETIQAVPSGSAVNPFSGEASRIEAPVRRPREGDEALAVESVARELKATLDGYCQALGRAHPDATVYVCLSGGLDSTGVLMLALEHLREVVPVSFDIARDAGPPSADRLTAERLAEHVGRPLLRVTPSADELLAGLDEVLREGVDWRDFNVHAALVNHALGRAIAEARRGRPCLVLTGDLPNEYLVDYHAEQLGGRTYYALPRLPAPALQAVLVRGLDTSHREVGPLGAWSLPAVQVYAPAVDHYLALPDAFLAESSRKDRLSRLMFGDRIPEYVYSRPKTRAQVGDADVGRGVLGLCLARGIDQPALRRRFAELHGVEDPASLDRFIRAGRYRSALPRLTEAA
jgi:asparagine synthetase B (glutamine-hydrolysing)